MLSGKPRVTLNKEEPTSSQLPNEVRKSTLSETLKQSNADIGSMTQHPGTYLIIYKYICIYVNNLSIINYAFLISN